MKIKEQATVGIILRRGFRRYLMTNNIEFSEDKGLINSLFIITLNNEEEIRLYDWLVNYYK